ncbi:MAG TPA: hypothetical protein VKK79_13520 [Candidatus Lokiarchaeia archaeon]|nr:hypothetical protein [Candidatus Lokiarchaeia archaeon]
MLQVKIDSESGTRIKNILVIDGHSHLGIDVDGASMQNPLAPGSGTFDFWKQVQGRVIDEWAKTGEKTLSVQQGGSLVDYSFEIVPHYFPYKLFEAFTQVGEKDTFKQYYSKMRGSELIDMGVCFPFQDQFRKKNPEAEYNASNINVSRFVTKFPFSLRMIGYGRCNPMEGEAAVKEVDHIFELGLRGLKLHPRSEQWIDTINSPEAVEVLCRAAYYAFPVIFDTRGRKSILDIAELIATTRQTLQSRSPELVPYLKVLIGHCGQGNIGDEEVYTAITQPNTWGELSMLHGEGAGNFFASFRKWCEKNNIAQRTGRKWSEYLIFGTDYPYFGDQHAQKLIQYLFNKNFFENGGTLEDCENILGLNEIKVLPEYSRLFVEQRPIPGMCTVVTPPQADMSAMDLAIQGLAKLIEQGNVDISKILFQFNGDFRNYENDVTIQAVSKRNPAMAPLLTLMQFIQNKSAIISTISQNSPWKQFGYKYFTPEDRQFFFSAFAASRPSTSPEEIAQIFANVF